MKRASSASTSKIADRDRLLVGMIEVLSQKGFSNATVADVVAQAGVSKRTFYENFSDKEECFVECYQLVSNRVLETLEKSKDSSLPWRRQVHASVQAYLRSLQESPLLTRTFFLEVQAAGPRSLRKRREIHEQFAKAIVKLVQNLQKKSTHIKMPSPILARAIVGAIHEIVLLSVEKGRESRLLELEETASKLVCAVISSTSQT